MEDEAGWAFSDVLPLPFRVVLLVQFGVYLWYALVWYCFKVHKMNCLALLNFSYSPHKYSSDDHNALISGEAATSSSADLSENSVLLNGIKGTIGKTISISTTGLIIHVVSLVIFREHLKVRWFFDIALPTIMLGFTLVAMFWHGDTLGQERVWTTLKRVMVGNINSATMRTNDILFSDSLTSYAKVLNDAASFLWSWFFSSGYNVELEAMTLAFPGIIRISQCWYEFRLTGQKQHLFNQLKYTALLGPVFVNMLIKMKMVQLTESPEAGAVLKTLNLWWYFLSAVSSTYLFVWDVRMDWGFEMFENVFGKRQRFVLLRDPSKLIYKNYLGYYLVICVDFILRFIWVFKIFAIANAEIDLGLQHRVGLFLFGYDSLSFGFFFLELLEILRRWLWCFLKLESDMVKLQSKDELVHAVPLMGTKMG